MGQATVGEKKRASPLFILKNEQQMEKKEKKRKGVIKLYHNIFKYPSQQASTSKIDLVNFACRENSPKVKQYQFLFKLNRKRPLGNF